MPPPLKSAIYRGSTTHKRRKPGGNEFTYPVYMAYVDLVELESGALDCWPTFCSHHGWSMTSLLSRDHMYNEPHTLSLLTRVRNVVERETGERPKGRICLLTNLRVFGVEFNPVSFYYVFDEENESRVETLVAEVSNFPWFEQHNYVISAAASGKEETRGSDDDTGARDGCEDRSRVGGELRRFCGHPKAFHVSPFMGIEGVRYEWLVGNPGERIRVRIGLKERGKEYFMARLDAHRLEWGRGNVWRMQMLYPLHTLFVMGAILYQAGKLLRKGVRFFAHPQGVETKLSRVVHYGVVVARGISDTIQGVVRRAWGERKVET